MRKWPATLISALLLTISFPVSVSGGNLIPAWVSLLAVWFGYIPLALALRNENPKTNFIWGYVCGVLVNLGTCYWFYVAMKKYGGLPLLQAVGIMIVFGAAFGLRIAISFWALSRFAATVPYWIAGTLINTLIEWLLTYFPFNGFPWIAPAYGLYSAKTMIQIVDLTGLPGLHILIFLCTFTVADVLSRKRNKLPVDWKPLATFGVLFFLSWLYGTSVRSQYLSPPKEQETLSAVLLQANIPQDEKWDPGFRNRVLDQYRGMTSEASALSPDLIVWSEASLPMLISSSTLAFPFLADLAPHADVIVGASTWSPGKEGRDFRNSAFVVSGDGRVRFRYDKQHLVPFGEYVPFAQWFPVVRKFIPSVAGSFVSGDPSLLPEVHTHPYSILICYEVLFPDVLIDRVRSGAQFFVNMTNDAWFDRTSGPFQHLHFGIFRAVETRRTIIRAANTGITTWYDPSGELHSPTSFFTKASLPVTFSPRTGTTFYVRHPHLIAHLATYLLAFLSLGLWRRRRT